MLENTAGSGVLEHALSALSTVFCVMGPVGGGAPTTTTTRRPAPLRIVALLALSALSVLSALSALLALLALSALCGMRVLHDATSQKRQPFLP